MIRVIDIVEGTCVDGPGLRTAIYVAGCRHRCPGCHNPSTWAFDAGTPMTAGQIMAVVREADFNVTLTGGDPIYSAAALLPLARMIKEAGYTLWLYTGYAYASLPRTDAVRELLEWVDVVVDGPFVEAERDISLRFRGSRNQRIVDARTGLPLKEYDK